MDVVDGFEPDGKTERPASGGRKDGDASGASGAGKRG